MQMVTEWTFNSSTNNVKFKETYETLAHIEKEQPQFFSMVDLSGLAWQMTLNQEQATTTAFTQPGQGQFQRTQTPSTTRLDFWQATRHPGPLQPDLGAAYPEPGLIVRSSGTTSVESEPRLGTNNASVMGFFIEFGMVKMDPDQLGNAHHWTMPEDTKAIRAFLGLWNFFRGHIKDYTTLSAPLNCLL